jgi:toxin secretion/phage lysis holin
MNDFINWIVTVVAIFISDFLGGFDKLIKALSIFILVDYITSIICIIIKRSPISKIGLTETSKKAFMLIFVGVANTLDVYITNTTGVLRTIVILFYLASIGKSILKNAEILGVMVPLKLQKEIVELSKDEQIDDEENYAHRKS